MFIFSYCIYCIYCINWNIPKKVCSFGQNPFSKRPNWSCCCFYSMTNTLGNVYKVWSLQWPMNDKRKSVTQNKFTSLILQFNISSSRFEFFIALIQYHEFDLLKHMLLQNAYYYLSSLRLGSILASIYNFLHIVSFIPIDKSHNSKNQNGDDKLHHISISAKDNS